MGISVLIHLVSRLGWWCRGVTITLWEAAAEGLQVQMLRIQSVFKGSLGMLVRPGCKMYNKVGHMTQWYSPHPEWSSQDQSPVLETSNSKTTFIYEIGGPFEL